MRIIPCFAIFVLLSTLSVTAASAEIFTIGIIEVSSTPPGSTVNGFKTGMSELGYIEGKDIRYIYRNVVDTDEQQIDNNIRELLSLHIDLLLAVANEPSLRAKKAVEGTETPVIAAACMKMVQAGIVGDLKHPGDNITGLQVAESTSKALEWLVLTAPNARRILIQYNPEDDISSVLLPEVNRTASQLGITLDLHEVHNAEEALAELKKTDNVVDAVFNIPSPTLLSQKSELNRAAIEKGLPTGSSSPMDDVVVSFGSDRMEMGRQAARLAYQIIQGARPSDLPVEISEVFLKINLKLAEEIGLKIPDSVLVQAKIVNRETSGQ